MLRGKGVMRVLMGLALLGLVVGISGSLWAAEADKAEKWQFHAIVDAAFVAPYVKVPKPAGVLLIDSRPYKPKFANGHIPTAISLPHSQFDKLVNKLPADKSALLVFYCQGPT
jgi:hypothetical protein